MLRYFCLDKTVVNQQTDTDTDITRVMLLAWLKLQAWEDYRLHSLNKKPLKGLINILLKQGDLLDIFFYIKCHIKLQFRKINETVIWSSFISGSSIWTGRA